MAPYLMLRDAIREGRTIVYTKKIKRKIILSGSASKGQPLHRACSANRSVKHFTIIMRLFVAPTCRNSVACVRLLVDAHAPIECIDSNRATPLIIAAGHSSLPVLNFLLHVSPSRCCPPILSRLCPQVGANVWACDKSGRTPLHWAAAKGSTLPYLCILSPVFLHHLLVTICSGNLPFVQALLADSNVNARDERGCTPLHLAAAGGFHLVVSALLQAKAKASVVDNVG